MRQETTDPKIIAACKILLEHSFESVKIQRHTLDLPPIEKRFKKLVKEFDKNPDDVLSDVLCDIRAMYNWTGK